MPGKGSRAKAREAALAPAAGRSGSRTLAKLWVGAFCASLAAAYALNLAHLIETDNLFRLVAQLSSSYSVYLGTVLVFVYKAPGDVPQPRAAGRGGSRLALRVAIVLSALWNGIILLLILRIGLRLGSVEDTIPQVAFLSSTLSWLVAPGVAAFFATSEQGAG